jgi:hypothetical protein
LCRYEAINFGKKFKLFDEHKDRFSRWRGSFVGGRMKAVSALPRMMFGFDGGHFGLWHFASFRGQAAIRSVSE